MSQKPNAQSARQPSLPTPAPTPSPSTPRPDPWRRDGCWVLNGEGRPVCMLLPNTTEEPKKILLEAGDTAWQRDELLARLRDVATAPGLEGQAIEAARELLAELEST
jgi:hypothetical protein